MGRDRFGTCLGRVIELSDHDVSEILEEQGPTGRRFGEVALQLRMCRPEDVWAAWWHQLGQALEVVDLNATGVDAQALAHVPRLVAEEFGAIPLRAFGNQLVIAVGAESLPLAQSHLSERLSKQIRFVLASEDQIRDAGKRYYATPERAVLP